MKGGLRHLGDRSMSSWPVSQAGEGIINREDHLVRKYVSNEES